MDAQHAPARWHRESHSVVAENGAVIARCLQPKRSFPDTSAVEHADFIVRACNNHEALTEALEVLIDAAYGGQETISGSIELMAALGQARAALKSATE